MSSSLLETVSTPNVWVKEAKSKVHCAFTAWGDNYIDLLLGVAFPTLAAPGNLPHIASEMDFSVDVYTSKKDAERIKRHPSYAYLCEFVPVNLNPILDTLPPKPYPLQHMNDCQREALKKANREGVPVMLFTADVVMSDGLGVTMCKQLKEGKRIVVAQGLRLSQEDFLADISKKGWITPPTALSLTPRQLVGMALKHIHPYCAHQFIDHDHFIYSAELYWNVANKGILCRNCGLAPFVFWPSNRGFLPEITLDDNYVDRAIPNYSDYYVIRNSDEGVLFSLTKKERMSEAIPLEKTPFDELKYARTLAKFFISKNIGPTHLNYFKEPIRLIAEDIEPTWWNKAETASNTIVESVLLLFKMEHRTLFIEHLIQKSYGLTNRCIQWVYKTIQSVNEKISTCLKFIGGKFDLVMETLPFRKTRNIVRLIIKLPFSVTFNLIRFFLNSSGWLIRSASWKLIQGLGGKFGSKLRVQLLTIFGAKIDEAVQIHVGVEIETPSNITLGYGVVLGRGAQLLGRDKITANSYTVVGREVAIYTGYWKDLSSEEGRIWKSGEVNIGTCVLVGPRSIVMPGTKIPDGAKLAPFTCAGEKEFFQPTLKSVFGHL